MTSKGKSDSTKNQGENRRGALKKILAGGGVIVGAESLPTKWTSPVIESIVLPAHAGMSVTTTPLPQ